MNKHMSKQEFLKHHQPQHQLLRQKTVLLFLESTKFLRAETFPLHVLWYYSPYCIIYSAPHVPNSRPVGWIWPLKKIWSGLHISLGLPSCNGGLISDEPHALFTLQPVSLWQTHSPLLSPREREREWVEKLKTALTIRTHWRPSLIQVWQDKFVPFIRTPSGCLCPEHWLYVSKCSLWWRSTNSLTDPASQTNMLPPFCMAAAQDFKPRTDELAWEMSGVWRLEISQFLWLKNVSTSVCHM